MDLGDMTGKRRTTRSDGLRQQPIGSFRDRAGISCGGRRGADKRAGLEGWKACATGWRGSDRLRLDGVSPYRCCFDSICYVRIVRVGRNAASGKDAGDHFKPSGGAETFGECRENGFGLREVIEDSERGGTASAH